MNQMRHENSDAKQAFALNSRCPSCGALLALRLNLVVERDSAGRVIGAMCSDCEADICAMTSRAEEE